MKVEKITLASKDRTKLDLLQLKVNDLFDNYKKHIKSNIKSNVYPSVYFSRGYKISYTGMSLSDVDLILLDQHLVENTVITF